MRVKYISNSVKKSFESGAGYIGDKNDFLKNHKQYFVYGMKIISHSIWYYIYDESGRNYPEALPGQLFEIVDGRLSKYWDFTFYYNPQTLAYQTLWIYPEWINDRFFHDRLIQGNEDDVKILKKYQSLMNVEFPDPKIKLKAEAINYNHLLCMSCINSWKILTDDAMVICPHCHTMMHNPTYTFVPDFSDSLLDE